MQYYDFKRLFALLSMLVVVCCSAAAAVAEAVAVTGSPERSGGRPDDHRLRFTSPAIREGLEVSISGRQLRISPGLVWVNDRPVTVEREVVLSIPGCSMISVKNEPMNLTADGLKGLASKHVLKYARTSDQDLACIDGVVVPGSVIVKPSQSGGSFFKPGIDFELDVNWGALSRLPAGTIKEGQRVYVDYVYFTRRLDTLVVDESGRFRLVPGQPARSAPEPPEVDERSLALANILAPPGNEHLKPSDFMPISRGSLLISPLELRAANRKALARTIETLRSGRPLKIAFWGDSITAGADADAGKGFVEVLVGMLKQKYRNARIDVLKAGIGGSSTKTRLADFDNEVMAADPDLLVVEFVNDIHLPKEVVEANYQIITAKAREAGAEVIIVNPHLPAPRLLGMTTWHMVPRHPFFQAIRKVSAVNGAALADVARRWEKVDREGLTPELLLLDKLVHPNNRGHAIYAEEIFKCFL